MTISKVRVNNTDHDLRAKYLVPSSDITPTERTFTSGTSGVSQDMGEAVATVQKIKGNTISWNQLIKNGNFSNGTTDWGLSAGITTSVTGNTITVTKGGTGVMISQPVSIISGHSYYISFIINASAAGYVGYFGTPTQWFGRVTTANLNKNYHFSVVLTAGSNKTTAYFGAYSTASGGSYTLSNIWITDLTDIYGSGNEPTAAQFEASFPLSYYNYTTSTTYGVTASGIKSVDAGGTWASIANLNITSLTGKQNGTGSSVTIFPTGLRLNGTTYDELTATGAIKRIDNDNSVLGTPQTYVLDAPLNMSYASAYNGTESILSELGIPSAPMDILVSYSAGDIAPLLGTQSTTNGTLKNLLDAMVTAGVISAYTMVYNADTGKYDFTITS